MLKEFKTRVQYLEEIKTKPDLDSNDEPVKDTGGRNDLFFAVHKEDVNKFAVSRLSLGIRYIEDALSEVNEYSKNPIYPEKVLDYASWNKQNINNNKPILKKAEKPACKLVGEDGNVFNIIGLVSKALRKADLKDKAKEFSDKALKSNSYDDVLNLCHDYVDVC